MTIRSLFFCSVLASIAGAQDIRILPSELHLDGREAQHRLLVEEFDGATATGPLRKDAELRSDDESIVRVEGQTVVPVGDGQTTVRAIVDDKEVASAPVTVTGMSKRFHWTFRNHVQAILAKQGCNSGACHGALAGKGGFRLSLHGYDPDRDHFCITTQQLGRRTDLVEPAQSLLLTKPTAAVPHKGGKRLEEGSRHYQVISEWIADGAQAPSENDARLQSLEILPEQVTLRKGQVQPLIVRAQYSDGRVEDVTQWAKFTSANEAVATVDEAGVATVIGPGEGAVTAWFGSRIVIGRITSPFDQKVTPDTYLLAGRRNFIDDLVLKQLRRLNLKPSARSTDEVFIRRAFLDSIGTLPTPTEVREFINDGSPSKRDVLIESLLARPGSSTTGRIIGPTC